MGPLSYPLLSYPLLSYPLLSYPLLSYPLLSYPHLSKVDTMTKLLHSALTYRLRGAGFQVHNALGGGHDEADYEKALVHELEIKQIPFQQQPTYRVDYRGQQVGEYHPDLAFAAGAVLLDLKAALAIEPIHKAQMISYLAVTNAELGLDMNFGAPLLQVERLPNFLGNRPRESAQVELPADILHPAVAQRVLAGLTTVYRGLGPGFLHQVYRRAMRIELSQLSLNSDYLKELPLRYRNITLAMKPVRFFLVEQRIMLATVALQQVTNEHHERLRWALRETGCQQGLIANFDPTQLEMHYVRN